MDDKDPQDAEILDVINGGSVDPEQLIEALMEKNYAMSGIIEALQRALERGKIALNSEGMIYAIARVLEHAA